MKSRSTVALIVFCAASTLVASLGFALLFTSVTVAFAVVPGAASGNNEATALPAFASGVGAQSAESSTSKETFSGMVTDDRCGARHAPSTDKSPSECVNLCLRNGAHYQLVDGDKSYQLEGSADGLGKVAGQRASVVGQLTGDTIRVSAVSATH